MLGLAMTWWLNGAGLLLEAKAPVQSLAQQELAKFQGTWEFVQIEVPTLIAIS